MWSLIVPAAALRGLPASPLCPWMPPLVLRSAASLTCHVGRHDSLKGRGLGGRGPSFRWLQQQCQRRRVLLHSASAVQFPASGAPWHRRLCSVNVCDGNGKTSFTARERCGIFRKENAVNRYSATVAASPCGVSPVSVFPWQCDRYNGLMDCCSMSVNGGYHLG